MELSTPGDRFFDYCLWEYDPVAAVEGKYRSVNLLFHSFAYAGVDERLFELVRAIQGGIGAFYTVWGVKLVEDVLRWELYFYDYRRLDRKRSMAKVLDILAPFAGCDITPDETRPYFMFSIDIGEEVARAEKNLEEIHMYIGNPGSSVSSGICYALTERETRLENFYFFFNAEKELEDIVAKVVCSAHVDVAAVGLERVLWPRMKGCKVIVVANKQQNDSVYFSRIDVDQLIFFLEKMQYPDPLIAFVVDNRSRFDHLLYDVGIDYRMEGGNFKIIKSGYYGIF